MADPKTPVSIPYNITSRTMHDSSRFPRRLSILIRIAIAVTALCSILGFAGNGIWQFDQLSHFRLQYCIVLSAGALSLLASRRHTAAGAVAGLALINLNQLIPAYFPSPDETNSQDHPILRIASVNIQASNRERKELSGFVSHTHPDFLLLLEVDPSWHDFASELKQRYAYSEVIESQGYFGLALYSRFPIRHTQIKRFGSNSQYALIAELDLDKMPFTIIGVHVTAPVEEKLFHLRNRHFRELATITRNLEGPVILAGDLNASTWSPYFKDLIHDAKLKDARQGFGIQPTWPVQIPFLRIPIDHCLVSESILVENWIRGPDIGSDHFPILVDFSIQKMPRGDSSFARSLPRGLPRSSTLTRRS